MTSFTRKLFSRDPGAAKALRKDELNSYRYGRHVTLAQFAADRIFEPAFPTPSSVVRAGQHAVPFGKRLPRR